MRVVALLLALVLVGCASVPSRGVSPKAQFSQKYEEVPRPPAKYTVTLKFPAEFPRYAKCVVGGERFACYTLDEMKRWLQIWHALDSLRELPALTDKQHVAIVRYYGLASAKSKEAFERKKANFYLKQALALRREAQKSAKWRRTLETIGWVSVAVLAAGAGVGAGYLISSVSR